jgi:hypothetical protein
MKDYIKKEQITEIISPICLISFFISQPTQKLEGIIRK